MDTDSFHTGVSVSLATLVLNFFELFTRTTQNGSLRPVETRLRMFESIFTVEDDLKSRNEDFEREENLFF